ncbi:MAG: VWA domain-containing protein [Spirochaetales bacterium]|nr:VWA domain-containing protein [Spirochaetales bacterium]
MKKKLILLFLGFAVFVGGAAAENIDVIVMVDITWSLYESYDDIEQYLLGALLDEVLQSGDTFHLLRFSDDTNIEITEVIRNKDTNDLIRQKLSQLKNLRWQYGHYTNLVKAISDLISFTESRPKANKKVVILITDGINDPPPGAETPANADELRQRFLSQADQIKRQGWEMHILRIPGATDENGNPLPGTQDTPFFDIFNHDTNTDITDFSHDDRENLLADTAKLPRVIYPQDLGEVGEEFSIPFVMKNNSDIPLSFQLKTLIVNETNILTSPVDLFVPARSESQLLAIVKLPEMMTPGKQSIPASLEFEGDNRILSRDGTLNFTFVPGKPPNFGINAFFASIVMWTLLGLAILTFLVIILLFLRMRGVDNPFRRLLGGSRAENTVYSAQQKKLYANGHHSFAVEMIVSLQKRQIGHRNIHRVPKGRSLAVGGKRSAFLIFLVPVPKKIALFHFDGTSFSFIPRKKEYFPAVEGPISDCLDIEIPARSKKGYEFTIKFERYISPLEKIHAIFHSVKKQAIS